jgi:putative transposase
LGQIIGYFKYQSTKDINNLTKSPGKKIWQRSFYDRIIRDEKELYRIRKYIEQNPIKWEIEMEHPNNIDL